MLEPHRDRLTWDFPIHSVADVEALAVPAALPELEAVALRLACERLFDFYDYCDERGIAIYGGGQFELGAGPRPDPAPRLALPCRTCRTTSRRRSTTRAARGRGCRRARSRRLARAGLPLR